MLGEALMRSTPLSVLATAAALSIMLANRPAAAQTATAKSAPAAADWAALAKLPDLNGVWEIGLGGGGGGRGRGLPQGPSLTPAAAAKRKELQSLGREDSQTANCVPPGMPGIMGQPYPMEFLLTPGKVTIVIEAYMQVRHIYTDGRNDKGAVETWGIEGMSPNYLGRRGWTKNSLKPGDKVSIVVRPMRDGSPGGMFVRATLADGRELRPTGQAVD